jgi:acyl carrier protein
VGEAGEVSGLDAPDDERRVDAEHAEGKVQDRVDAAERAGGVHDEVAHLDPGLKLREQIELDSMDFLDIVMELRKRYGVHVPEADYKELATLDGCVNYLAPLLAKTATPSAKVAAR